jgi:hypothetical protein
MDRVAREVAAAFGAVFGMQMAGVAGGGQGEGL